MGIKLFMSKLTNDKTSIRNKLSNEVSESRNRIASELKENTDSYVVNKTYSKIDHIVGIRTLDLLVRDICNSNPYKALDLYLRVVNPQYIQYSGFLKTLIKDTKLYSDSYVNKYCNNAVVMNNGREIPYMEIVLRRDVVSQLRAMQKYVNDNMMNIVRNSKNATRTELVGVCKSRISKEMVQFNSKLIINDYEERSYKIEPYKDEDILRVDITGTPIMKDMEKEIYIVGQHKLKLAKKAQIALIYNAIQENKNIDCLKDTLEYEEYEIAIKYVKGLDGNTYEIIERLLRERLPKETLDIIDETRSELISKLKYNLNTYRNLHNTQLISYLVLNILDSLK